jgi:pilus assembly protein CpaE
MLQPAHLERPLPALLICPDREIAREISRPPPEGRCFEILSELRTYPTPQTLDIRLRQIQPAVVLLDMASDFEQAGGVLRRLAQFQPPVYAVALHASSEAAIVIGCLRAGAIEFLHAPFAGLAQKEACARIRRLLEPDRPGRHESGRILMFSSAKPGAGASTLATQTAFSLRRQTGQRVLLADLDLMGGSIAISLKTGGSGSVLDAVAGGGHLDAGLLASLVAGCHGLDVLAAPSAPPPALGDLSRIRDVLDCARQVYDWVVADLPVIFNQLSLFALSEADFAFLVATPDLSSLHLARRSVQYLEGLGFGRERLQVLLNRLGNQSGISAPDLAKILACPVLAMYPEDYPSLHRAIARAEPLPAGSGLGRAVSQMASKIAGRAPLDARGGGRPVETRPALSES